MKSVRGQPGKLQNLLTKEIEAAQERLQDTRRTPEEKARARAAKGAAAKAACLTQPTTQETSIPPEAMKFAVKYRLGTAEAPEVAHCVCGTAHPTVNHILSCKHLRGRFVRHDVIVNVLSKMLSEVGLTCTIEVMVLDDSQKRMDIVITLPTGRVWLDVSFVNPLTPTYVSDRNPKLTREKAKKAKWTDKARRAMKTRFIPFIIDTFGGVGDEAMEFLKFIASRAYEKGVISASTSMEHAVGQYRWGLVQRIGAAVAHTNACMIEEARVRSSKRNAKTKVIFKAAEALGKGHNREHKRKQVYVYGEPGAKKAHVWPSRRVFEEQGKEAEGAKKNNESAEPKGHCYAHEHDTPAHAYSYKTMEKILAGHAYMREMIREDESALTHDSTPVPEDQVQNLGQGRGTDAQGFREWHADNVPCGAALVKLVRAISALIARG